MTVVLQDRNGPDWPLGNIVVPTPGTPVEMMSLVDSADSNAPQTATPPIPNSATRPSDEYTVRCQQIMIQGFKAGGGSGALIPNVGNIYICRKGGSKADLGTVMLVVPSGQTLFLSAAAKNLNVLNPYRYTVDADTADDAAQITLVIQ